LNDYHHLISIPKSNNGRGFWLVFGVNMGEVIGFVSKTERERARLIQAARAIYDSIFPSVDPISEQRGHTVRGSNAYHNDEVLS
jgi:hypothetical protein